MTNTARIRDNKSALRAAARARRSALDLAHRAGAAEAVAGHLSNLSLPPDAVIAGYWPIGEELDTRPALHRLAATGFRLCLPVTGSRGDPLVFRRWGPDSALVSSGFGTMAPAESEHLLTPTVLLMPLLAFDAWGNRLGYGAGHYDRTLAGFAIRPLCIGLAFAAQEVDTVPREAHDRPMDMIITETGVRHFAVPSE
ncbi:5-formyltetrahydrofolate cyclo-ligase [Devosia sp.]|uniref:5-formyltetrahydrofolate cyclo-ligase n=1 Tax=Devosia sp. TaxID=1871048 RepID=UPI003A949476